jgi:hypothetical protein
MAWVDCMAGSAARTAWCFYSLDTCWKLDAEDLEEKYESVVLIEAAPIVAGQLSEDMQNQR